MAEVPCGAGWYPSAGFEADGFGAFGVAGLDDAGEVLSEFAVFLCGVARFGHREVLGRLLMLGFVATLTVMSDVQAWPTVTDDQRGALLTALIGRYANDGWSVQYVNGFTAVLSRKRKLRWGWHLLWTLLTGFWVIVWIIRAVTIKSKSTTVMVDEYGRSFELAKTQWVLLR